MKIPKKIIIDNKDPISNFHLENCLSLNTCVGETLKTIFNLNIPSIQEELNNFLDEYGVWYCDVDQNNIAYTYYLSDKESSNLNSIDHD